MSNIVEALKRFNRKERYWLLRNALGDGSKRLGDDFRQNLGEILDIKVPAHAWWAMDYHLDSIIGALHLCTGGKVGDKVQNDKKLVHGTHGDVDMVVAFNKTLILIEAKGVTAWSNSQLNPKVDRLVQIFGEGDSLPGGVTLRFVLTSPLQSNKLVRDGVKPWPKWMTGSDKKPLFQTLKMDKGLLKVVRCGDDGKSNKDGKSWNISN